MDTTTKDIVEGRHPFILTTKEIYALTQTKNRYELNQLLGRLRQEGTLWGWEAMSMDEHPPDDQIDWWIAFDPQPYEAGAYDSAGYPPGSGQGRGKR